MAFGTASTGTAISSLSGAALTNATLAALGGGSIAAGGGGIALGTTILGATSLGVGLLVGGIIFSIAGSKLSDKADEAWVQMEEAEARINSVCSYLHELSATAEKYYNSLSKVNGIYREHLNELRKIVNQSGHKDWNVFTQKEKKITENTVLLVGLLYNMCKVELVLKGNEEEELNTVNKEAADEAINAAEAVLADRFRRLEPES